MDEIVKNFIKTVNDREHVTIIKDYSIETLDCIICVKLHLDGKYAYNDGEFSIWKKELNSILYNVSVYRNRLYVTYIIKKENEDNRETE